MKRRPTGITIIAVVYLILGLLSLLWGGLVLGVGGLSAMFGSLFGAQNMAAFGGSSAWSGFLGIVSAVVQIVVGIGMLRMARWAWYLAFIGVALTLLQGVLGIFGGGFMAFLCGGIGLIIPIIILVYLLSSGVRAAFGIGSL